MIQDAALRGTDASVLWGFLISYFNTGQRPLGLVDTHAAGPLGRVMGIIS